MADSAIEGWVKRLPSKNTLFFCYLFRFKLANIAFSALTLLVE